MRPALFRIDFTDLPAFLTILVAVLLVATASATNRARRLGLGLLGVGAGFGARQLLRSIQSGELAFPGFGRDLLGLGSGDDTFVGFPAYFLLLLTGFVFATAAGAIWARRIGRDPDVIVDLGLAALLAGVAGGRLLHVVADGYFWDYVNLCVDPSQVDWKVEQALCSSRYQGVWDAAKGVCHPAQADCFAWAKFWSGGLTYYGGLIAAAGVAWFLLKRDRFPFWKAADMAGFAIPIGLGFGRIGCLLAGCCFGVRTDGPLGLSFPPRSPASEAQFKLGELSAPGTWSHGVHPTQIYESFASFAIAAVCLLVVHPRKRYDGQVFVAFLGLYAAARFALEYLRADDRGGLVGLSTSQLIGLALMALAFAIHHRLTRAAAAPASAPAV